MSDGGWLGHTELGGDVIGDPSGSAELDLAFDQEGIWQVPRSPSPLGSVPAQPRRTFRIGRLIERGDDGDEDDAMVVDDRALTPPPIHPDDQINQFMSLDAPLGDPLQQFRRLIGSTADGSSRSAARESMYALWRRRDERRRQADDAEQAERLAARREALDAALARQPGPRLPQAIVDVDQRVPENLIDALAQHAALANRSYTAPTNGDSIRQLAGFVPELVGNGTAESSRSESPLVAPLPTISSGRIVHKRRRAATLTADGGDLSRFRQALHLSHRLATLPALPADRLPAYMRHSNSHISEIPEELNEQDKCERITLSSDAGRSEKLIATFSGDGSGGDDDAAAVRADKPIPRGGGIYYYEAEVISVGVSGYIAIGMCNKYTNLERLTGWEPESYAWHLDDGYFFKSQGHGINMGWPKSGDGDVIGCGVDADGRIFFTKNGQFVGKGCTLPVETDTIYPAIGLRTPGEKLRLNFRGPFKYDIEQRAIDRQKRILDRIATAPVCISLQPEAEKPPSGSSTTSRLLDMLHLVDTEEEEKPPGKKSRPSPLPETAGLVRRPRVSPDRGERSKKKAKGDKEEVRVEEGTSSLAPKMRITDIESPLGNVVLDYLRHSGYAKTTAKLLPQLDRQRTSRRAGITEKAPAPLSMAPSPEDELGVKLRNLHAACKAGDMGGVTRTVLIDFEAFWRVQDDACQLRGVAVVPSNWVFRLHFAGFLSLLQSAWAGDTAMPEWVRELFLDDWLLPPPAPEVIDIAQRLQEVYSDIKNAEAKSQLEDAFALLAYDRLEDVPAKLRNVLDKNRLEALADDLLRSIREHEGSPSQSVLEQTYRQAKVAHHSLTSLFGINVAAYTGNGVF